MVPDLQLCILYMPGNFLISTTKFALLNDSEPDFYVTAFQTKRYQEQLCIDLNCHLSSVNWIQNAVAIDLLQLKQANDIPGWYPLLDKPYSL